MVNYFTPGMLFAAGIADKILLSMVFNMGYYT